MSKKRTPKKAKAAKKAPDPDLSEVGLSNDELDETLDLLDGMKHEREAKDKKG